MIWFRKKATGLRSPQPAVRAELLCDRTLAALADEYADEQDTPYVRFVAARASLLVGDRAVARRHLHELLALPTVTTQEQLLAWNCLRDLDELPSPGAASVVRGVVVDQGTPAGLETLAAYADRTAKWIHADGTVLGVDAPGAGAHDAIDGLLTAARAVVAHTDPHRGAAENPPEAAHTCLRVLTFAGTHVGLGPTATLERDPVGGAVLRAAAALQQTLLRAKERHADG